MDTPELLDEGFAWTAARLAAVPSDGLSGPTPCDPWTLQDLLDHTIDSLTMLVDAVAGIDADATSDGPALGSTHWDQALAALAARGRAAWAAPGVMERSIETPMGTMAAPAVAMATVLETVVHGWDISQATGEALEIPDALALPILEFARQAIADADRGDDFAPQLDTGDTPSDHLVAFLGRKPR